MRRSDIKKGSTYYAGRDRPRYRLVKGIYPYLGKMTVDYWRLDPRTRRPESEVLFCNLRTFARWAEGKVVT